ncbi:type B DNA-directed DNA polymerase [Halovenus sp. HT40]|uniref:type B DNA-directed DNA polymerase n=1 Tax=Halovenus sp. HT40 TaxID=3126691 RepID=UPI00300F7194
MVLTIDFTDEGVVEWHTTSSGVRTQTNTSYTPTIYVSAETESARRTLAQKLELRDDVEQTRREHWRPAFRRGSETVLRIDVSGIERVQPLAGWIRRQKRPGTYRLFNVDFSRAFRYCLEQDLNPSPTRHPRTLELAYPQPGTPDPPLTALSIGDDTYETTPETIIEVLQEQLATVDPDVLVLSTAELMPALFETAAREDKSFQLGRESGYEQLAGHSTYESYGQVGHSPARYNVPGRAIIDESNTFFYDETNLNGCLDLVERSKKPLQELSWASIGNVLTAIQIREALSRNVLVPWKSWRHEFPKRMRQLHEADRGGFTFTPEVGVYENVHELDFSSLYPNIICTRNISPETIRCDCHDRADVPGLGYSICDAQGYLPEVLQPIIDDRDALKTRLAQVDDPETEAALQGQSDALKWILVSCFGYQGFSNAKFGRIECHEAINAYAREILLEAKAELEAAGWRVVHGIVDSLWVTPRADQQQTPLEQVAETVTQQTRIRLEYEGGYEWIAFVPLRNSDSGALTKYFGKKVDGSYKFRGIECRQRSTPAFIADCQRALISTFDETRDPDAVCVELGSWVSRLETGAVAPQELEVTKRTSKRLEEYTQSTQTTAALQRRTDAGQDSFAGTDISYVVVDDEKSGRERVRLPAEDCSAYDTAFYRTQLIRAAESVLSPIGWREDKIRKVLSSQATPSLDYFGAN